MNRIICVLVMLLLAGCQGHAGRTGVEQTKPVVTQQFLHPNTLQEYAVNVRQAVQYQLLDADSYAGKACTIKVKQFPGKSPESINSEGGDPSLCVAALKAIRSAIDTDSFPYKPSGAPDVSLDFRL